MFARTHRVITGKAVDLASRLGGSALGGASRKTIVEESANADEYPDVEFVNVEGGLVGSGRDDPHQKEWLKADDEPHTSMFGLNFSRFNHFIDIRKGPGIFDDYDGYSFRKGSASKKEYQTFRRLKVKYFGKLPDNAPGTSTVDAGLNSWFADEYVHAPGHRWYKGCSDSIARYSFRNAKRFKSVNAEAKERFPLAAGMSDKRSGVPWSVFMPVDNMARYWFQAFRASGKPRDLGPCMHAVQDAAVPHHAAGCWGNWHAEYERDLDLHVAAWSKDATFMDQSRLLLDGWLKRDQSAPRELSPRERTRAPGINWRVDMLVTWLALQAHHAYKTVHAGFLSGYSFKAPAARDLAALSLAMSALVLAKASG